jgi:peptidyl-prolyl cis-trans isomerase D
MLIGFRNVTKGWLAGGLLGLLALVLLVVGGTMGSIGDVFAPAASNALATGRGVSVPVADFERRFESALDAARQENKQNITREQAMKAGMGEELLNTMISEAAIDAGAKRAGFHTSNAMIADAIRSMDEFKSQFTGAFDKQQYASILARNGLSQKEFEDDLRKRMSRRQFATSAVFGIHAPNSLAKILFDFETERRVISAAQITMERAGAPAEPTDAQLQGFYKENIERLKTPEMRNVTVVRAAPAAIAAQLQVPEEKVKELYEYQKRQYAGAERRTFIMIAAPNQQVATEAARALASNVDPAKIAANLPVQIVPMSQKVKQEIADPVVAETVFAMQKGQTSGAINGKLAWTAVRLLDVTVGVTPSYESKAQELRNQIAMSEAQDLVKDKLDQFDKDRGGGKSVEEAAQAAGLLLIKLDRVTADGARDGGGPAPGLADVPDLVRAAFQTAPGESTDFVPTPDNGYAMVSVDKVLPPGVRSFEEVKPALIVGWKNREITNAMNAIADRIKKAVEGGQSLEQAAAAEKVPVVVKSAMVDRRAAQEGQAPALVQMAFNAGKGDVVAGPDAQNRSLLVAVVEDIKKSDPTREPQLYVGATQAANQMLTNDMLVSLEAGSKEYAKLKRTKLADKTLGVEDAKKEAAKP